MGVEGAPPVSGSQPSPIGPNDQQLTEQYSNLIQNFLKAWTAYDNNPSPQTEQGLTNIFSQLKQFIESNKGQIEQLCNSNGWASGGPVGYDTNIAGALNNLSSMMMPPNTQILQMLNESLTSVKSMMMTKS